MTGLTKKNSSSGDIDIIPVEITDKDSEFIKGLREIQKEMTAMCGMPENAMKGW
jgi:hypothetical protein